jgi:ABC-2 type transport system ATP-binding protein
LLRERNNGAAILISTHLLDTAEKLCDRVIIVARGHKVAEGTLQQLQQISSREGQSLEEVFLALTEDGHAGPVVPII